MPLRVARGRRYYYSASLSSSALAIRARLLRELKHERRILIDPFQSTLPGRRGNAIAVDGAFSYSKLKHGLLLDSGEGRQKEVKDAVSFLIHE